MEEVTIFEVLRDVILWLSPAIFCVGLFLILAPKFYKKLEEKLNKEIGGIRKRVVPKLEKNINTFQTWMLTKNNLIGLICILSSFAFFLAFRR
jgi:hypothetical protein